MIIDVRKKCRTEARCECRNSEYGVEVDRAALDFRVSATQIPLKPITAVEDQPATNRRILDVINV